MNNGLKKRRLPAGIQSFEEIREDGYLYVDKTDLVWQLAHDDKFCFLSRPRRFGKSLLLDTLACYFEGKKELFEGLRIMQLEEDWKRYPVLRFDMSEAGATEKGLIGFFNRKFREKEKQYDIETAPEDGLSDRFVRILQTIHEAEHERVVILIDEYDSPLQHSWKTPEHDSCTAIYREVFSVLKSGTQHEKFVFITGITTVCARREECQTSLNISEPQPDLAKGKFTQISLFSVLNNLTNISFMPEYATICGITKQEMLDNFMPEIERMATKNGWSVEEAIRRLKDFYDGYHFSSENMEDIYNPFSLVRALSDGSLRNHWVASGATSMLPKFVADLELNIRKYEHLVVDKDTMETSDVTGGADLFLYQSGYLTIKAADKDSYTLGFPNEEVRRAMYKVVIPALTMHQTNVVQTAQTNLFSSLKMGLVDDAMLTLKSLIADVPYSNKKLSSIDMEERYRFIISSIFHAIGLHTEVEHMMSKGRIDVLTSNATYIYVIELKLTKNGGLAAAEQQIRDNLYAAPFQSDGRSVIALAIELDDMGKGILGWKQIV